MFVMYCVYGASRSSLLIESTDSMINYSYFNNNNYRKDTLSFLPLLFPFPPSLPPLPPSPLTPCSTAVSTSSSIEIRVEEHASLEEIERAAQEAEQLAQEAQRRAMELREMVSQVKRTSSSPESPLPHTD